MTTVKTIRRHGTWSRILRWGLLLWVLSAFVTAITANLVLAVPAYCTRRRGVRSTRDGAILGATVGLGFAAFETAGALLLRGRAAAHV